jgi:hypothetical protein
MVTDISRCLLHSFRPRLLTSAWNKMQLLVLSCHVARLCWGRFEYTDLCSVSWHRIHDKPDHIMRSLVATKNITECLPHRRLKLCSYTNLYFPCFTQKYIFPVVICCRAYYSLAPFPALQIAMQLLRSSCCGLLTWDVQGVKENNTDHLLPCCPARHAAGFKFIRPHPSFELEHSDHLRARRRVGFMNHGRRKASALPDITHSAYYKDNTVSTPNLSVIIQSS